MKQQINEQFKRMQQLAGILNEDKETEQIEKLKTFFKGSGTGDEKEKLRSIYIHFQNNGEIDNLEPRLKNLYNTSPGIFNFSLFTKEQFIEIIQNLSKETDDETFLEKPSFSF